MSFEIESKSSDVWLRDRQNHSRITCGIVKSILYPFVQKKAILEGNSINDWFKLSIVIKTKYF